MKNNILVNNNTLNISDYSHVVHLQNVIKNNHIITKDYELEPFWHVYAVDAKYDVVGDELVTRFKARPGYRRKDNGEIKSLEKRMFHHNLVVYINSLNDLYYYYLGGLRFKARDIARLKSAFKAININAEDYLNQFFY